MDTAVRHAFRKVKPTVWGELVSGSLAGAVTSVLWIISYETPGTFAQKALWATLFSVAGGLTVVLCHLSVELLRATPEIQFESLSRSYAKQQVVLEETRSELAKVQLLLEEDREYLQRRVFAEFVTADFDLGTGQGDRKGRIKFWIRAHNGTYVNVSIGDEIAGSIYCHSEKSQGGMELSDEIEFESGAGRSLPHGGWTDIRLVQYVPEPEIDRLNQFLQAKGGFLRLFFGDLRIPLVVDGECAAHLELRQRAFHVGQDLPV